MNCKPGDLAVVVNSVSGNLGKIVQVIKLHECQIVMAPEGIERGVVWKIDPPLLGWAGKLTSAALDYQLRPIRDNDGEDETMTWAGKPESVNA